MKAAPLQSSLLAVPHGFFTRDFQSADVAAFFGVERLVLLDQVHGAEVLTVSAPFEGRPKADGMVTDIAGLALCLVTADCAPMLFLDPVARVCGAAHAGWRGAKGGIVEHVVVAMEALGAQRNRLRAAIGPCIGPSSYEVQEDFRESFDASAHVFFRPAQASGYLLFDLPAFLMAQCKGFAAVEWSGADTYQDGARFFSYRRGCKQGIKETGRMISGILLR